MTTGLLDALPSPWNSLIPSLPTAIARAPGRLDVMGGIADYSGATVAELPLALHAVVAAQAAADDRLTVRTDGPALPDLAQPEVVLPMAVLDGPPAEVPEQLRAALREAEAPWAAYLLGPLAMLRAAGLSADLGGVRLSLWSTVPSGAGISSSAAIEVASLRALTTLLGQDLEPMRLAHLAQQAEHRVAGAPCGIMDQVTATLGRRDHLLLLRCQPAEVLGHRRLPREAQVMGIDSAVAHRVAGAQYGRVRVATFMGRAIIAAAGEGDPPGGYLCNLPVDRFLGRYRDRLPETLSGAEFLARYGTTGDDATIVEPDVLYRVRECTTHPLREQEYIEQFLQALDRHEETGELAALAMAGEAMYRSHRSYSERCHLGSPETDLLVDLVREHGGQYGLYGAKITGGGSGGTVAVLGAGQSMGEGVAIVTDLYRQQTGNPARVITGSSGGAAASPAWLGVVDQEGVFHAR